MRQARYKYAVAKFNEYIYVAGGKADAHSTLSTVECYDPSMDTWSQIPNMNHPRENFTLVGIYDRTSCFLYALGFDRTVERYDEVSKTWTVVCI